MNRVKLSCLTGLCLLAANATHATATWIFDGTLGSSGPFPVDSVDDPIQLSSQLSLNLPNRVEAVVIPGAQTPGSGDYLLLAASSFAVNNGVQLSFTLNASAPVEINSLSYAAIVFNPNQGPDQITWSYSINYGAGNIGPSSLVTDTFRDKGSWQSYNPDFNIATVAPATITISGSLTGRNLNPFDNGSVGFDNFSFDINPIPEPSTGTLLLFGLVFLVGSRVRHASRHRQSNAS